MSDTRAKFAKPLSIHYSNHINEENAMLVKVRRPASILPKLAIGLLFSISIGYAQTPGTVTTVLNLDDGVADVSKFAVWSVDAAGNVYCVDRSRGLVLRVSPLGDVTAIAGNGTVGSSADFGSGQPASSVAINPAWVAVDHSSGDVVVALIAERGPANARISPDGIIRSYAFDLQDPFVIEVFALDELGATWDENANSYHLLSDSRIVRISPEAEIETIAIVPPEVDFDIAFGGFGRDSAGNFYIAARIGSDDGDEDRFEIVRLAPDGLVTPVAGGGEIAVDAVFGPLPAMAVELPKPPVFTVASNGTLYQAFLPDSSFVSQVARIDADGTYNIIAGTGARGYSGDGSPALVAQFDAPYPIGVDHEGNLYVWDTGNHSIRKIAAASSNILTGSSISFRFGDRGGVSLSTVGGSGPTTVGYGRIRNEAPEDTPAGIAILSYRRNGVVVSETTVPAAIPIQGGRLYAAVNAAVNTGIAIANPSDEMAMISFFYTSPDGVDFGHGVTTVPAHAQIARFLSEAPFSSGVLDGCTFTFTTSVAVSVVALRGRGNERGDFLMTILPIASLELSSGNLTFPHFADGNGWATEVVLVNPANVPIAGAVRFLGPGSGSFAASAISVRLTDGSEASSFRYTIPSHGVRVLSTSGASGPTMATGTVRVIPDTGSFAPSGFAVFSLRANGVLVTEAGVPAGPEGMAFRLYAQMAGGKDATGSIRTGIAVANEIASQNRVNFDLTDLDGVPLGSTAWRTLSPSGQYAAFVDELFPSPAEAFSGILRVTSADGPITVTALRSRVNERSDFLIAAMPPVNESAPTITVDQFFPQIVAAGGWTTQFILFGGRPGSGNGQLTFTDQTGNLLELQLGR